MLANVITLARFPLLAACLAILYFGSPALRLGGAVLLLLGLLLDTVDGIVARGRAETSLIGSVLDIAADRTYELALWVAFAHLGLIPALVPLLVLARTTLTDALRGVGVAQGTAPLEQQQSRLARFLVASAWMRTGYAVTKVAAFCCLALSQALAGYPPRSSAWELADELLMAGNVLAWVAVLVCLVRGAPVIAEATRRYWPRREPAPG